MSNDMHDLIENRVTILNLITHSNNSEQWKMICRMMVEKHPSFFNRVECLLNSGKCSFLLEESCFEGMDKNFILHILFVIGFNVQARPYILIDLTRSFVPQVTQAGSHSWLSQYSPSVRLC